MNTPQTLKTVVMSVNIEELFTDAHKSAILDAVTNVESPERFHTTVLTPLYLVTDKTKGKKAYSQYEYYDVTIVTDYKLISSLVKNSMLFGVRMTPAEKNLVVAESIVENIYEQYAELISFQ